MANDAKLEVVLTAKNLAKKGFESFENDAKKVSKEVNSTFTKMATAVGGIIGGIAVGSALLQVKEQMTAVGDAYFSMSETFQGETDAMVDRARQMAESFNHYYDFTEIAYAFTKTADSMKRYGIDGQRYLELVARAADVGAAKNLELKESIDRIESAIRGEAEASEYLGLTLNDTYMKNMAFNGTLKDTWEKLSDNEKAFYRYNELMAQSGKYAGAADRATNTLSGALRSLAGTLKDNVAPNLESASSLLATIINKFTEAISKNEEAQTSAMDVMIAQQEALIKRLEENQRQVKNDAYWYEKYGQQIAVARRELEDLYKQEELIWARQNMRSFAQDAARLNVMEAAIEPTPAPGGGGGGGGRGVVSSPARTIPDSDPLAFWRPSVGVVSPDLAQGMQEAHQRYLAIISETTAASNTAYTEMAAESQTWVDGALAGLAEYQAAASDTFQGASDFFGQSMSTMEDALVDFVTTGKLEWRGLIDSILSDLARLMIRQNITGPLAGALGAGLSGLFPGAQPLSVTSGASLNTAFGATGGVFSGPTTGYPAIMHGTEAIVPLSGGRAIPVEMRGGGDVQVVINNHSGEKATVRESQSPDGMRQIMVQIGNDILKMGPTGRAVGQRFGLTAKGMA